MRISDSLQVWSKPKVLNLQPTRPYHLVLASPCKYENLMVGEMQQHRAQFPFPGPLRSDDIALHAGGHHCMVRSGVQGWPACGVWIACVARPAYQTAPWTGPTPLIWTTGPEG